MFMVEAQVTMILSNRNWSDNMCCYLQGNTIGSVLFSLGLLGARIPRIELDT